VSRVTRLEHHDDIMALTSDAKVVALRWDLAPWGLVVDLDTPTSEAKNAPVRRAWLVFSGLGDVTWPFQCARVPNGCWTTTPMVESKPAGRMRVFNFSALLPQFGEADQPLPNPGAQVVVTALSVHGLVSSDVAAPGPDGLSWVQRTALATDLEFVEAARELF
jgi:hypothetical protein